MYQISSVELLQYVNKGLMSGLITLGGWVIMFPIRQLIKHIKTEWTNLSGRLQSVETELTTQRTNCLHTLQEQGNTQIDLLGRACSTLEAIHLSQAEMSGYFKAKHEH